MNIEKEFFLPDRVPVVTQPGLVLFPYGFLPLTLVEPEAIQIVEEAIRRDRFIGVVQPRQDKRLFNSGCLGRITTFSETAEGVFLVLYGVCRFKIKAELRKRLNCRRVSVDYLPYVHDMAEIHPDTMDRRRLLKALNAFMRRHELPTSLDDLEDASDEKLLTAIAMAAPFSPEEKQAILELPTMSERCSLATALIEMANISKETSVKETCH